MAPEKRERKKPEKFDPHPPGSKHQMMSSRSKKVKDKKLAKSRMQKLREGEKVGDREEAVVKETTQNDDADTEMSQKADHDASKEKPIEQNKK